MNQPETVMAITGQTTFREGDGFREKLEYNADLGFLAMKGSDIDGRLTVVGYSQPEGQMHAMRFSTTRLARVPPDRRNIDDQGKGVGTRLYNTAQAAAGLEYETATLGVYSVSVTVADILRMDGPESPIGTLVRIARHAGRIARDRVQGLAVVTDAIHESYGAHSTVLISQPPRARMRERKRGVRAPVPSRFLIVRDPHLPLCLEGYTGRPW